MICFDIETGPLPDDQLRAISDPFVADDPPGEFEADSVKLGNLKDATKIAAKIEAARLAHKQIEADFADKQERDEAKHWSDIVDKAALSPITGRVLAIGYHSTDTEKRLLCGEGMHEIALLEQFWLRYDVCKKSGRKLVGHNILGFDVPFLIRRSWVLGVDVPGSVLFKDKHLDESVFVDTMKRWQCGNHRENFAKLDKLARLFGLAGKPEDIDGGDFARLWFGSKAERAKALDYLNNDITMTVGVAQRLGIS